jgi:hypothetical protein
VNLLTVVSISLLVSSSFALVTGRRQISMLRESWRRELEAARALDAVGRALEAPRHLVVYELRMALLEGRDRMLNELRAQARPRPFWRLPPAPGEDWPDA